MQSELSSTIKGLQSISIDDGSATDDRLLVRLSNDDSPGAMTLRLNALLRKGDVENAVVLAQSTGFSPMWCDVAMTAFVRSNQHQIVEQLFTWAKAQPSRSVEFSCALAYALAHLCDRTGNGKSLQDMRPAELTAEDRTTVEAVWNALVPCFQFVKSRGAIEVQLELESLSAAMYCAYLLTYREELLSLRSFLWAHSPIPLVLAYIALRGGIEVDTQILHRLRSEHKDSFETKLLATNLEAEVFQQFRDAFEHALELRTLAKDESEKERLYALLLFCGQRLGPDALVTLDFLGGTLVHSDHRLRSFHEISKHLSTGDHRIARRKLTETKDLNDPLWLQHKASQLLATGDDQGAAECFWKACELLPHDSLLRRTADVAISSKYFGIAAKALELLRKNKPQDSGVIKALAYTYSCEARYSEAAELNRDLYSITNNPIYLLQAGHEFVLAGNFQLAIGAFNEAINLEGFRAIAIASKADALLKSNEPAQAFESMRSKWPHYNESPEFVGTFMKCAYAAGHDDEGDKALKQLANLRDAGRIPADALKPVSLEEVKEVIHERLNEKRKLMEKITGGTLPWLSVDAYLNNSYYWAWVARTGDVGWILERNDVRSEFSIYATNGFDVRGQKKQRRIAEVKVADVAQEIVVDLSALLTLHRLGVLSTVIGKCRSIVVPTLYSALIAEEAEKLQPHQPTRLDAAKHIVAAVAAGRIRVLPPDAQSDSLVHVDEFIEKDETSSALGVRSLLPVLEASGELPTQVCSLLKERSRKRRTSDVSAQELGKRTSVLIDIHTLYWLRDLTGLQAVLNNFEVWISSGSYAEANATLRSFEMQDEVRHWHTELWQTLRNSSHVKWKACNKYKVEAVADEIRREYPIAAFHLANELNLPLLADDRCLTMTFINEGALKREERTAFDTSHFLSSLYESGKLSLPELSEAFFKLIKWRYRFMIPPVDVMKLWTDEYCSAPPGIKMRTLATYVHDCIRDGGLFTGLELADPPMSLAAKFLLAWGHTIGSYIKHIWLDETYSDDKATAITRWVISELLPSVPRSMGAPGVFANDNLIRLLMGAMLIDPPLSQKRERENAALLAVKEASGMEHEKYLRNLERLINVA